MYTRVAIMIPLTFCVQTDQVKRKRQCYKKILLLLDVLVYVFLLSIFVYQMVAHQWGVPLLWSILSVILTSAICLSLLQIWKYSQKMAKHDSLKSRGLLCAHLVTFLAATIITTISCVLD